MKRFRWKGGGYYADDQAYWWGPTDPQYKELKKQGFYVFDDGTLCYYTAHCVLEVDDPITGIKIDLNKKSDKKFDNRQDATAAAGQMLDSALCANNLTPDFFLEREQGDKRKFALVLGKKPFGLDEKQLVDSRDSLRSVVDSLGNIPAPYTSIEAALNAWKDEKAAFKVQQEFEEKQTKMRLKIEDYERRQ